MKTSKTKHKNDQYVWLWCVYDGENWVGISRSRKAAVEYARSLISEEDMKKYPYGWNVVEIEMRKYRSADLFVAVTNDFVDSALRSFITKVEGEAGDPYEVELAEYCTERQKRDLTKRLKAAVKSWQSEYGITVPTGRPIETKNDYFVHASRKMARQAEAAE